MVQRLSCPPSTPCLATLEGQDFCFPSCRRRQCRPRGHRGSACHTARVAESGFGGRRSGCKVWAQICPSGSHISAQGLETSQKPKELPIIDPCFTDGLSSLPKVPCHKPSAELRLRPRSVTAQEHTLFTASCNNPCSVIHMGRGTNP